MKSITAIFATLFLFVSGASLAQDAPPFEEVDANGDGAVTSSELAAAGVDIRIGDADNNGDGTLDRSEYEAAVSDS